jgi:hypothetical protein
MTKLHSESPTRSDRWSVGEIVDLPIVLEEERFAPNRDKELLSAREALTREFGNLSEVENQTVLRAWLARWRKRSSGNAMGARVEDTLLYAGRIAGISGFLLGLAAASDRLFFTGPEPLNVFALLGVFVLLPLVLSIFVFATFGFRQDALGGVVHQLFLRIARAIARWKHATDAAPATAFRADDSWPALRKSLGRNGTLLQLSILSITQKFAFAFGLGLLVMLQLRVSFWELAFGWQTTLTAPGEVWHAVVRVIAAPWSWFWPEGCPTLEQINATRYSRLDGAARIDPAASRAWWPFLAASILVWSVLLRGLILLIFRWLQRKRLTAFDPETPDAHLLLRRLMPSWSSTATASPPQSPEPASAGPAKVSTKTGSPWVALTPDEPDPSVPSTKDLEQLLGVSIGKEIPYQFDDSLSDLTAAAFREVRSGTAAIAVLLPSSRDPIDEVCDTLKAVEESANGKTCILILRGGRDRLGLWKQKLGLWQIDLPVEYVPTS